MNKPQQAERRELWLQRVAQQKNSGETVRAFCRRHKLSEYSFYWWRRQFGSSGGNAVRFALVEAKPAGGTFQPGHPELELILTGGERLRIPADANTLRVVLSALRPQK